MFVARLSSVCHWISLSNEFIVQPMGNWVYSKTQSVCLPGVIFRLDSPGGSTQSSLSPPVCPSQRRLSSLWLSPMTIFGGTNLTDWRPAKLLGWWQLCLRCRCPQCLVVAARRLGLRPKPEQWFITIQDTYQAYITTGFRTNWQQLYGQKLICTYRW